MVGSHRVFQISFHNTGGEYCWLLRDRWPFLSLKIWETLCSLIITYYRKFETLRLFCTHRLVRTYCSCHIFAIMVGILGRYSVKGYIKKKKITICVTRQRRRFLMDFYSQPSKFRTVKYILSKHIYDQPAELHSLLYNNIICT